MPCIGPDGKPTDSGMKILRALKSGPESAEKVAEDSGMPLFRVRSGLRQLIQAGFADLLDSGYKITEKGAGIIE